MRGGRLLLSTTSTGQMQGSDNRHAAAAALVSPSRTDFANQRRWHVRDMRGGGHVWWSVTAPPLLHLAESFIWRVGVMGRRRIRSSVCPIKHRTKPMPRHVGTGQKFGHSQRWLSFELPHGTPISRGHLKRKRKKKHARHVGTQYLTTLIVQCWLSSALSQVFCPLLGNEFVLYVKRVRNRNADWKRVRFRCETSS